MPSKLKTVFVCSECGFQTGKWQGKCNNCGAWNTMIEEVVCQNTKVAAVSKSAGSVTAKPLSQITVSGEERYITGIGELDRVLGGGIVKGSVVLLSGDPGIGQSTILLQLCSSLQDE